MSSSSTQAPPAKRSKITAANPPNVSDLSEAKLRRLVEILQMTHPRSVAAALTLVQFSEQAPESTGQPSAQAMVLLESSTHDNHEHAITTPATTMMEQAWNAYQQWMPHKKLDPTKCLSEDICTRILSFVGPGHFLYVAGVSKKFKELYQAYFATIKNPAVLVVNPLNHYEIDSGLYPTYPPVTRNDTFYSAAFSSVSCAALWMSDPEKEDLTNILDDGFCGLNYGQYEEGYGYVTLENHVCRLIAKYGQLEVLKWARQEGFEFQLNKHLCSGAAEGGHLEILQYLHQNECPWGWGTCKAAAVYGHLECLEYAHDNGCWSDTYETCAWAAGSGHLNCLKYAHDNGCNWGALGFSTSWAAHHGHLECLKYARENGCEWNENACAYAAENGHLECLQYAHDNGSPWTERTCMVAAENGHLECLQYARANECPWNPQQCLEAAMDNDHTEVADWVEENMG